MLHFKMKTQNYKRMQVMKTLLIVSFMSLILINYVSAGFLGVVSKYSEIDPPVELYPGQSIDTYFVIQNVEVDSSGITVESSITQGSEIARITSGSRYNVEGGEQKQVDARITIPEDAVIGTEYTVEALFKQVAEEGTGGEEGTGIGFAFNVDRSFRVKVVPKPAEPIAPVVEETRTGASAVWLWIVVIIVVVLIVWWIIMARKKKAGEGMQQKGK